MCRNIKYSYSPIWMSMTYVNTNKDIIMDIMTDLTLQDFNPLSKHVKYAQVPDEPPASTTPASTMHIDQSAVIDYPTKTRCAH